MRIKLLLTVSLIVSALLPSFAQIRAGVKGGANFLYSRWEIPGIERSYSGISYHAGVYGNVELIQSLNIQTEIQFNSFKIDYSGENYSANYISIPVVASYSFLNKLLNIHAGPQVSFLLKARPETLDFAINNTELAVVMGSGVTLNRWNVTARYILGISNLASDEARSSFPEASIHNNNLQISLGYQLFGKLP